MQYRHLSTISSLCFVKLHRTITKFKNFSDRGKQLPIFISLYFTAISLVSVRYEPASTICIFNIEKQHMQFCTFCTCVFHLFTFHSRSRLFHDVKLNDLFVVVWTTRALDDKHPFDCAD